jgi:hypothetical protein
MLAFVFITLFFTYNARVSYPYTHASRWMDPLVVPHRTRTHPLEQNAQEKEILLQSSRRTSDSPRRFRLRYSGACLLALPCLALPRLASPCPICFDGCVGEGKVVYLSFSKRKNGARVLGALGTGLRTERRTDPTPHPPFFFPFLPRREGRKRKHSGLFVALHNSEPLFLLQRYDTIRSYQMAFFCPL